MAGGGKYTLEVEGRLNDAKIRAQLEKLNNFKGDFGGKGFAKMGAETKKANAGLVGLGKTFLSNTKKVAMFGASTAILGGFTAAAGEAVRSVLDLDRGLTELKKVSDLQGDSLKKYTDQAFEAGKTVAKTGTEMVDAATEFKKSGWNEKDALILGTVAAKYTNIADTEVSTAEASKFLISQIKAFNIEAKDSEHIIDATNETANNFAVGTNDLSTALTKAASGLGTVGNSFEQTIGLTALLDLFKQCELTGKGILYSICVLTWIPKALYTNL